MKKYVQFLVLLLCTQITAQSYIDEARKLVRFQQLYKLHQNEIDALMLVDVDSAKKQDSVFFEKLAAAVLKRSKGPGSQETLEAQGSQRANNGIPQFGSKVKPANTGKATTVKQPTELLIPDTALEAVKQELRWYLAFSNPMEKLLAKDDFPASLEFLDETIKVLENSNFSSGNLTFGIGLGSLFGVSQANVLKGVSDWALSRAQEELMQSFLREWLEKIRQDSILQTAFPNTLNVLATSDLTSVFTDGDTWKATFQQDFQNIPKELETIGEIALNRSKKPIKPEVKREVLAGLRLSSNLFGELGKKKKADDVLLVLGEKSFLDALNSTEAVSTLDRVMIITNIFIESLSSGTSNSTAFIDPKDILKLSTDELRAYWKLTFLRGHDKFDVVFKRKNPKDQGSIDFYNAVCNNLLKLKLHMTHISEAISSISRITKNMESPTEEKTLSVDEFHIYVSFVFDIVEVGVDVFETFSDTKEASAKIAKYKDVYLKGFEYVMLVQEGIKTKEYGKVALNVLNIVSWIQKVVNDDSDNINSIRSLREIVHHSLKNAHSNSSGLDKVEGVLTERLKSYPKTKKLVLDKLADFKTKFPNPTGSIADLTNTVFRYSKQERREIVKEFAENRLLDLRSSNEAINKYAKLMASIILAEDSNDIKNILDEVALKTGGYLVKQKSVFSGGVSFYPGIEFGSERIDSAPGQPSSDGTYIGATLPIGVELALGTDWNPIGAIGLFIQVLDLGAVLNYSLSNDDDLVGANANFGFEQVLSPGGYLTFHFTNSPLTIGAGVSYSPSLREIGQPDEMSTIEANAIQWGIFAAVDLNVFSLFSSKRKISLPSKSLQEAYDN